jgi:hypothetical protein
MLAGTRSVRDLKGRSSDPPEVPERMFGIMLEASRDPARPSYFNYYVALLTLKPWQIRRLIKARLKKAGLL